MKSLFEIIGEKKVDESPPSRRIDFSFQELGIEMTEKFGEKFRDRIWPLFHHKKWNEQVIREAFEVYKKGEHKGFEYFMGILHRMR